MKTVYYAIGGGLGHLTRARRVLRALDLEAAIISSGVVSEGDDIPAMIAAHAPDQLIMDTFPFGIRHEVRGAAQRIDYVARRLRLREYALDCGGLPPLFHTTYLVEELEEEHLAWIHTHSSSVVPLQLHAPEGRRDPSAPLRAGAGTTRHWLIVHSGPAEEVRELIDYTRELMVRQGETPRVLVATRCDMALPPRFERVETPHYASAARIISAAGFNVMLETEPWRDKHHVVPFPRRFDDQFARAARRKRQRCL